MVAPRARSPRAFLAEAKISEVQRAACPGLDPGGAGRRGPALNFRRRHTRRPARRFLTEDLRSCRRSGLRCRTQACPELSALTQVGRVRSSPDPLPAFSAAPP